MGLSTSRTTANTPAEHVSDHNLLHAFYNGITANRQTDSYTLVLTDANKVIEMNKATGNTLTVPANSTAAFDVGTLIELFQYGAGQTTVAAAGGVTIRSSGGKLKLTGQYSAASLRKVATDEWALVGDIAT